MSRGEMLSVVCGGSGSFVCFVVFYFFIMFLSQHQPNRAILLSLERRTLLNERPRSDAEMLAEDACMVGGDGSLAAQNHRAKRA